MAKGKREQIEIDVVHLKRREQTFWLIGESPFYCNRMAAKAKRELLLPRGRLTQPQRATKLKHAPQAEYKDSPYLRRGTGETKLLMVGSAPKMAIAGAALRMPTTVNKTEIKQLVSVKEEYCPLWGIPRLDMSMVRMAGISRTPDIRTRARLDRWALRGTLSWIEPMLSAVKVATLADAAGIVCGLGDWRIEKGGPNGAFRVVFDPDDRELRDIIASGGADAQEEALRNPVCANPESGDLMAWYLEELARRGIRVEDEETEEIEVEADEIVFGMGDVSVSAPAEAIKPLPVQQQPELEY